MSKHIGNRGAGTAASVANANARAAALRPIIDEIRAMGYISRGGIAAALNTRGVAAARGGAWGPEQVKDLLKRLDRLAKYNLDTNARRRGRPEKRHGPAPRDQHGD
jgi:hypothetical protein